MFFALHSSHFSPCLRTKYQQPMGQHGSSCMRHSANRHMAHANTNTPRILPVTVSTNAIFPISRTGHRVLQIGMKNVLKPDVPPEETETSSIHKTLVSLIATAGCLEEFGGSDKYGVKHSVWVESNPPQLSFPPQIFLDRCAV